MVGAGGAERRQHARVPIDGSVKIVYDITHHLDYSSEAEGELVDISHDGMRFHAPEIIPSRRIVLKIERFGDTPIEAEVVSTSEHEDGWHHGLKFMALDDEQFAKVQAYLAQGNAASA